MNSSWKAIDILKNIIKENEEEWSERSKGETRRN